MSRAVLVATVSTGDASLLVGVIGAVLALVALLRGRSPKVRAKVLSIRWWRRRAFDQALDYLVQYQTAIAALQTDSPGTSRPAQVDLETLCFWGIDLLLTAASHINRYSQGKANLFSVETTAREGGSRELSLRSRVFVGAFPLDQLTDDTYTYRRMDVSRNIAEEERSVAARALIADDIRFDSVRKSRYRSAVERRLGATHILAIPLHTFDTVAVNELAVITVDFALPPRVRTLHWCRLWASYIFLMRRARRLQIDAQALSNAVPEDVLVS